MHGKTNAVFITGTDTDAGKTVFCAQLLAFLRNKGINAISQKWVQTGWGEMGEMGESNDAEFHASTAGMPRTEPLDLIVPARFKYPASPHLASKLEGKPVDILAISSALNDLSSRYELVLCEGSGGALVPLSNNLLISDFAAQLGLPSIIVCANKLGCINHCLLTVEALRSRGIEILGIAFTRVSRETDDIIANDNIETIRALSGEVVLGELAWLERPDEYSSLFNETGESFLKQWSEYCG